MVAVEVARGIEYGSKVGAEVVNVFERCHAIARGAGHKTLRLPIGINVTGRIKGHP
ncbi:MAG: hypothetical protein LWX51_07745 [Deltaproteobacteria bacterium]|nr:hypothetical protein [Deltaproteobacteria bacterium]